MKLEKRVYTQYPAWGDYDEGGTWKATTLGGEVYLLQFKWIRNQLHDERSLYKLDAAKNDWIWLCNVPVGTTDITPYLMEVLL